MGLYGNFANIFTVAFWKKFNLIIELDDFDLWTAKDEWSSTIVGVRSLLESPVEIESIWDELWWSSDFRILLTSNLRLSEKLKLIKSFKSSLSVIHYVLELVRVFLQLWKECQRSRIQECVQIIYLHQLVDGIQACEEATQMADRLKFYAAQSWRGPMESTAFSLDQKF